MQQIFPQGMTPGAHDQHAPAHHIEVKQCRKRGENHRGKNAGEQFLSPAYPVHQQLDGMIRDRQQQHYRQRSGPRRVSLAERLRERAGKNSSVFMAATAAGSPAARLVAKNSEARRRELSTADFQFHRCNRYFAGSRRSSKNACLTVTWPAVGSCRRELGAGCAQVCVVESGTIQLTMRARNTLLRQDSSYFNFPPILGKDYGVCCSTATKEFPARVR